MTPFCKSSGQNADKLSSGFVSMETLTVRGVSFPELILDKDAGQNLW